MVIVTGNGIGDKIALLYPRPWIEPRSPRPLANTLPARPKSREKNSLFKPSSFGLKMTLCHMLRIVKELVKYIRYFLFSGSHLCKNLTISTQH